MKNSIKLLVLSLSTILVSGCVSSNTNSSNTTPVDTGDTGITNTEESNPPASDDSSDSSSTDSSDTTPVDDSEWQEFSDENAAKAQAFLTAAENAEANVISNKILNGLVADGESSYSRYEFLKGKRSDDSLACYHKTPTQTTYYYYEGSTISGYVEKGTSDKTYSKAPNCNEKKFIGYDMTSFMIKSSTSSCGGYASLKRMFDNGSTNSNKDTQFKIRNNGFDMRYAIYSKTTYTYWSADISATFSSSGVLTNLKYKYSESYAKTVDKKDDGTFTFKSDAVLDYKETIYEATVGTLGTIELSVNPDNFYYSSFDIYSKNAAINDGDTITPELTNEGAILDVKNALPSTATSVFDKWTISTKQEGKKANTEDNYFDANESRIYLGAVRVSGTYSVVISTKNVSKSFTIYIGEIAPESINFVGIKEDTRGASIVDIKSTITVGESTNICAYISPVEAAQDISFNVAVSDGVSESDYTLVEHSFPTTNATLKYYTFNSTKAGTFTFTATSNVNPDLSATHTLKVISPLSSDEIYDGKYCLYDTYNNRVAYTFEFTPDKSTDALDGECKITTVSSGKYGIYTYSAAATSKKITLTYKTGVDGTVEDLFKISLTHSGTRSSVELTCADSPVEWETTYTLLDWADYLAKYGE